MIEGLFSKIGRYIALPFRKLFGLFYSVEGESVKPKMKNLKFAGVTAFLGLTMFYLAASLNQDTSSVERTDMDVGGPDKGSTQRERGATDSVQGLLGTEESQQNKKPKRSSSIRMEPAKYKAKQVIEREGVYQPSKTIPMGTNLIGRLLTSIDTREAEQFYKVFLPYGGKFQSGAEIPKGSTLFGKIRYPGKGKKVFIAFSKGVFPDGSEFELQAQALSTKDYSPGLVGDFHGQSGARVAAALGLSLVSGASAMLTEREQVGALGQTAPKATLKNAMFGGLSQTAQNESQRRAQKMGERQEYVTIDSGKDLIINLTGAYIAK